MPWRLITYRLPAEPSRHRVAVWRELRRLGAVGLQQGTWAVPDGEPFEAGFTQVVEAIKTGGGQPVVDRDRGALVLDQRRTVFGRDPFERVAKRGRRRRRAGALGRGWPSSL